MHIKVHQQLSSSTQRFTAFLVVNLITASKLLSAFGSPVPLRAVLQSRLMVTTAFKLSSLPSLLQYLHDLVRSPDRHHHFIVVSRAKREYLHQACGHVIETPNTVRIKWNVHHHLGDKPYMLQQCYP